MSGDSRKSRSDSRIGLFELLRDVLRDALDKSQFPIALITIILLSLIWKLSAADLGWLLRRLVDFAERKCSVGYLATMLIALGWLIHSQRQSREIAYLRRRS